MVEHSSIQSELVPVSHIILHHMIIEYHVPRIEEEERRLKRVKDDINHTVWKKGLRLIVIKFKVCHHKVWKLKG